MGNLTSTTDQRDAHMTEEAQEKARKAAELARQRQKQLEGAAKQTDIGNKIINRKKALEDSLKY